MLITILLVTIFNYKLLEAIENRGEVIYLDPGHGGIDGGAVSKSGIYEKDINLQVANHLKILLQEAGYIVYLTRDGDYDLANSTSNNKKHDDILKRVELINSSQAILYVSIHCNSYPHGKIHGAQTFYNPNMLENKQLSEDIQNNLITYLQNTSRVSKSLQEKYLLDNVKVIGCLVEIGFISNIEEAKLMQTSDYQQKVAFAIYLGIIEFLSKNEL